MRGATSTLADHHWINDGVVVADCLKGDECERSTAIVPTNDERDAFNSEYISQLSVDARDSIPWVRAVDTLAKQTGPREGKRKKGEKVDEK